MGPPSEFVCNEIRRLNDALFQNLLSLAVMEWQQRISLFILPNHLVCKFAAGVAVFRQEEITRTFSPCLRVEGFFDRCEASYIVVVTCDWH